MVLTKTSPETVAKIKSFFSKYPKEKFKKNQIVISAEENPHGIHYLRKGYVKMYSYSSKGQEVLLHIFTPGSYFPVTWALAEIPNKYFFKTVGEVELVVAPKKDFTIFMKQENDVLMELTQRLLKGLAGMLNRTHLFAYGDRHDRTISTLLFLAKHFGYKEGTKITINRKFTQSEIASFAGLARETTAYELKTLEEKGLITKVNRRIQIPNINALKQELVEG